MCMFIMHFHELSSCLFKHCFYIVYSLTFLQSERTKQKYITNNNITNILRQPPNPPKKSDALKGTLSIISSDPPCKDANAQFTTVPLKPLSDQ